MFNRRYLLHFLPLLCAAGLLAPVTIHADEPVYGWYEDSYGWRYGKEDGEDAWLEWVEEDCGWHYFDEDGYMLTNTFFSSNGARYYATDGGDIYIGTFFERDGYTYYANDWGGIETGWILLDDVYHFADLETGALYFDSFLRWNSQLYYIDEAGNMVTGWQTVDGETYYFQPWGGACRDVSVTMGDMIYQFDEMGHLISQTEVVPEYQYTSEAAELGVHTIKNLLSNAILPVGNTLYVWGGGHGAPDEDRSGLNPQWNNYFASNDATYNPDEHEYEYGNGLDCSGYVGWVGYQVFQETLVTGATSTPYNYAVRGWGSYEEDYDGDFYPGDICSKNGHAWVVIGQCSDGSVVVAHSNLAYVQISGTVTRDGDANSEAIALAIEYMSRYYPEAYQRYGIMMVNTTYLEHTYHFSWSEEVMPDVTSMRNKSPREILQILFHEV